MVDWLIGWLFASLMSLKYEVKPKRQLSRLRPYSNFQSILPTVPVLKTKRLHYKKANINLISKNVIIDYSVLFSFDFIFILP